MTGDARWTALFDRLALFLTITGFLLREWISSAGAGPGVNLFIHLLFWVALTLWFAGRATAAGGTWRFTGFEFAFLAFAAVSLTSVLRASFKLTALDHALAFLSLALFFVLCTHVLGRRTLLSMLLATVFAVSVYALVQRFVLFPMIQSAAPSAPISSPDSWPCSCRSSRAPSRTPGNTAFAGPSWRWGSWRSRSRRRREDGSRWAPARRRWRRSP